METKKRKSSLLLILTIVMMTSIIAVFGTNFFMSLKNKKVSTVPEKIEEPKQYSYTTEYYFENIKDESKTETHLAKLNEEIKTYKDNIKSGYELDSSKPVSLTITENEDTNIQKIYYKLLQYNISYNLNNGTLENNSQNPKTYTIETNEITLLNPVRKHYTFSGWILNNTDQPNTVTKIPKGSTGNKEYTAVWAAIPTTYSVEYYQENLGSETYSLLETIKYNSLTNTTVTATEKAYNGFTLDKTIDGTISSGVTTSDGDLILKLYYSRNSYTLTYDFDNETENKVSALKYATVIATPTNPTKIGYTFDGWDKTLPDIMPSENVTIKAKWKPNTNTKYTIKYYLKDLSGTSYSLHEAIEYAGTTDSTITATEKVYSGFTLNKNIAETLSSGKITPDGNLVLKLFYSRNSYTLTINYNNGTAALLSPFKYGATINIPEEPTKVGYTFNSWDKALPFTMPAEDTTITANWTANTNTKYNVEYYQENLTDGAYSLLETVEYAGTTDTEVNATEKTYTGFTLDKNINGTITTGNVAGDESLILKLYYSRNSYTLTFNFNNETENQVSTLKYGATITTPEEPTKVGYTFNGWDKTIPSTMPAENTTITAEWAINQYTITFNTVGGTTISPITQNYGTTVSAPANPTKIGYTFNSWDTTIPSTMPAEDTTITANWTANTNTKYNVEYYQENLTNGVYSLLETVEYTGTTDTEVNATEKTYTGFTLDKNINGTIATGNVAGDESLVLKLYYSRNSYTLTFNFNNGTENQVSTLKYGATITTPEEPTKIGHTFNGWDKTIPSTMPAENTTITTEWDINQYTITFNTTGGTAINPITQNYGTTVSAPTNPTKTGYTFGSWYSDPQLKTPYTFTTIPSENITLYARWFLGRYTLTYEYNGGRGYPASKYITYSYAYGTLPTPTRTGFTFNGWYADPEYTTTITSETIVGEGDKTIYAKWIPYTYTITFYDNVDDEVITVPSNQTKIFETRLVIVGNRPERTGYTFMGWAQSHDGIAVFFDVIERDLKTTNGGTYILYAIWGINSYTITFNTNGGSEVTPITQNYGTTISAPTNPTKTGYTFNNWDKTIPSTMPAENTTITANWIANTDTKYTVQYYQESEEAETYNLLETVEYTGTTDTEVNATEKTYDGFTLDKSIVGTVSSGIISPDGSLVLKLYYNKNT